MGHTIRDIRKVSILRTEMKLSGIVIWVIVQGTLWGRKGEGRLHTFGFGKITRLGDAKDNVSARDTI